MHPYQRLETVTDPAKLPGKIVNEGLFTCYDSRAPKGWVCTRVRDHDGPCAAEPKEFDSAPYGFAIAALAFALSMATFIGGLFP